LIKGEAFTTSFDDSCSSGLGESKSGNLHLWYFKKSVIISDFADDDSNLILSLQELANLGDGDWWSVDSGGNESSQDSLVERRFGSSGEESEQFNQKMLIKVGASGVSFVRVLNSTSFHEINTHFLVFNLFLIISLSIFPT
tara:strand:+ start:415 stop:837 length:423 start_codon:yes stop_codon:yes gene_type:complete